MSSKPASFWWNLKENKGNMEALVFAIIALGKGYNQTETFVAEPVEFQPFDLRALNRSFASEGNSSGRPSDRQNSLVTQIAS